MSLIELIRYIAKQFVESAEFLLWKVMFARHGRNYHTGSNGLRADKVLVIQLDSIGDVLMSTPALKSLQERFRTGGIDVLLLPHTRKILEADPDVGNIFVCPKRFWRQLFLDPASFVRAARTIMSLRKMNYGLCVDLGGTLESVVCARLADAKLAVGPCREIKSGVFTENTGRFYDRSVSLTEKHVLRQYLQIVAALGCSVPDEEEEYFIPGDDRAKSGDFLRENGLEGACFIVMHPGAKWPPRRWPAENFAGVVKMLFVQKGLRTVLVGSGADRGLLQEIKVQSGVQGTVLAYGLGLGEVASIIRRARVFIGNDSGPAHIAAAVGTPSVVLFGPGDPDKCAPLSRNIVVIKKKISCWPCAIYFRRDRCEAGTNFCLQQIKPADVFTAAERLMGGWGTSHEDPLRSEQG